MKSAMMSKFKLTLLVASIGVSGVAQAGPPQFSAKTRKVASAQKMRPVVVSDVSLSLFSQKLGKVISFDSTSRDPYGMAMDVMAVVKLNGDIQYKSPVKLTLKVSSEAESSEATGGQAAWTVEQSRELFAAADSGTTYVPFLFPYECRGKVTITAEIADGDKSSSKTIVKQFACAE